MKSAFFLLLALAATPALAQTTPARPGELTGARPSRRAMPAARPASRPTRAPADPVQARFLRQDVDLSRTSAAELPGLYENFMAATRAERRQWSDADWATAANVLARLNGRYQDVRAEVPTDDRLLIRSLQGEFYGLRAAHHTGEKVNEVAR